MRCGDVQAVMNWWARRTKSEPFTPFARLPTPGKGTLAVWEGSLPLTPHYRHYLGVCALPASRVTSVTHLIYLGYHSPKLGIAKRLLIGEYLTLPGNYLAVFVGRRLADYLYKEISQPYLIECTEKSREYWVEVLGIIVEVATSP